MYRESPVEENGVDVFEKAANAAGVAYADSVYQEIEFMLGGGEYANIITLKRDIDDAIEDWEDANGPAGLGDRTTT